MQRSSCIPSVVASLACCITALSACTYLHYVATQRDYERLQTVTPRQRTYKHLINSPNYFVLGKLIGRRVVNAEALAVIAVSDRYKQNEIVDTNNLPRMDSYFGLNLPAGEYRLLVVSDLDRDGYYDGREVIATRALSLHGTETEDKVVGNVDIDLDPHDDPISINLHVPVQHAKLLRESLFYPRGTIRSLDEDIFSPDLGTLGMFEPAAFLERAPMMFYALEEHSGYKVPVVFVHGITGTPRDFSDIVARLDRQLYQPWFFYYPTGTNLAQLSEFFYRIFLSGKVIPLRGMPMVVIAHSMGGLVIRNALNRYDGTGEGPNSVRLITIASPLGGMSSAAAAKFGGMVVPSWRDLVPHSDFLNHLHRRPLRGVEYDLIYTRGRAPTSDVKEGYDGVVPLTSQLDSAARSEAAHIYGFDAGHMDVLSDARAIAQILTIVESVKPPFPEATLLELTKGGFSVTHRERYSPLERHVIETEGYFLQALANGTLQPSDPAQVHFVDVCHGHSAATNEAEKAWLKFQEEAR